MPLSGFEPSCPEKNSDNSTNAPSVHYCTCVSLLVLDYLLENLRYTGQGSQVVPAVGCHSMHAWISYGESDSPGPPSLRMGWPARSLAQ